MADLPAGIPAIVRLPGHQSVSVHVYSHPRMGVAGSLCWGIWKGSENVRSYPQVKLERDFAISGWEDALDVLEQMIAMGRRQLALLDVPEE